MKSDLINKATEVRSFSKLENVIFLTILKSKENVIAYFNRLECTQT